MNHSPMEISITTHQERQYSSLQCCQIARPPFSLRQWNNLLINQVHLLTFILSFPQEILHQVFHCFCNPDRNLEKGQKVDIHHSRMKWINVYLQPFESKALFQPSNLLHIFSTTRSQNASFLGLPRKGSQWNTLECLPTSKLDFVAN